MRFFVLGLNYKTASLELRERFMLQEEESRGLLNSFLKLECMNEVVYLATCNRAEIYGVSLHPKSALAILMEHLSKSFKVPLEELQHCTYFLEENAAIVHGFKVAASLDSMILGEPQILGQFKQAYKIATEVKSTGVHLNKFFHRTFQVAKKIRSETEIGKNPVSVSYAAATLARQIFGDLSEASLMISGAGKMAELALKHLADLGVKNIYVANRTFQRAQNLAAQYDGQAIPFENFQKWLIDVEIIIASVFSERYLIDKAMVEEAMRHREGRSLFFIDIAVPRNIDPDVGDLDNVYLFNIDDLGSLVLEGKKKREAEAKKAKHIIEQEAELFKKEMEQQSIVPLLACLSDKIETLRKEEVERTLKKTKLAETDLQEALELTTKALVKKILHEPMVNIKENSQDSQILSIIKKIFNLNVGE